VRAEDSAGRERRVLLSVSRAESPEARPLGELLAFVAPLAVAQLVAWGVFYYAFALIAAPMEAELGWSKAEINGALSLGLAVMGLATYPVGRWIDRHGGRILMTDGRSSRETVREEVIELFRLVGIPAPDLRYASYPHELSGGMRQRVVIAMALACRPRVIVADEPTTALDVTVQAQVLDLIDDLKRRLGTAVILITHDLGVVAQWSDRIVVLYAGRKVEEGRTDEVLDDPRHPYTRALLAARPELDGGRGALAEIPGLVPAITDVPSGCAFADRCAHAFEACRRERPPLVRIGNERTASCFLLAREGVAA
jgi:oligopeptide/dipeptide ABC transporter ATP-binding protein